jgi:hypothetical protein
MAVFSCAILRKKVSRMVAFGRGACCDLRRLVEQEDWLYTFDFRTRPAHKDSREIAVLLLVLTALTPCPHCSPEKLGTVLQFRTYIPCPHNSIGHLNSTHEFTSLRFASIYNKSCKAVCKTAE